MKLEIKKEFILKNFATNHHLTEAEAHAIYLELHKHFGMQPNSTTQIKYSQDDLWEHRNTIRENQINGKA